MGNIYPVYYIIFPSVSVLFKIAKIKSICLKMRRAGILALALLLKSFVTFRSHFTFFVLSLYYL